jgi:hypothetical protein
LREVARELERWRAFGARLLELASPLLLLLFFCLLLVRGVGRVAGLSGRHHACWHRPSLHGSGGNRRTLSGWQQSASRRGRNVVVFVIAFTALVVTAVCVILLVLLALL